MARRQYDESDVRVRPSRRGSRPRTKERPAHSGAQAGSVVGIDRGRYTVLVGEPDVTNQNFLSLLSFLGFRKETEIEMPDKVAAFMVCERRDFERLSSRRRRVTR